MPVYLPPDRFQNGPVQPYRDRPYQDRMMDDVWEEPQAAQHTGESAISPAKVFGLIRKYWLASAFFLLCGVSAGFVSVVLSTPVYSSRVLLELQGVSPDFLKNTYDPLAATYDSSQTGIQTQITLLRSGPFLRRVFERMQFETVPPIASGNDLFSRLRRRVKTGSQDPLSLMKDGLMEAVGSFDARSVNGTRLIEMSCYAPHPDIAANFINTVASEFIEESTRSRTVSSRKTGEWLQGQIEETKANVKAAEERLQDFVRQSGNLFASQEVTVDDVKLKQLQAELAGIQADRINKQAKYEVVTKNPASSLPDLLPEGGLQSYTSRLAELRREKAALLTTLTPNHTKVERIQAQMDEVQSTIEKETSGLSARIRTDYETALRREKLLRGAYAAQAGQVTSQSDRAAQYNALKREVDTLRQIYNSLITQSSQASVSNSVPIAPIRLIEPSAPAQIPDRPRPLTNLSFGVMGGLFLSVGVAFLREKSDRRLRSPEVVRGLLRVPQLGVIPSTSVAAAGNGLFRRMLPGRRDPKTSLSTLIPVITDQGLAGTAWRNPSSLLVESFRSTLASIFHNPLGNPKVLLVSSPGPGEGKTTITAHLGFALAETGRTVLLIDCDFRQPRLHSELGMPNERGVTTILQEEKSISECSVRELAAPTETPGLFFLASGPQWEGMPRALHSLRFRQLIKKLQGEFDTIVIDAPPLLHFADARFVGRMSDGVILVLRAGITQNNEATEAFRRLTDDRIPLLGTILNDWTPPANSGAYQYYYSQTVNNQDRKL